MKQNKRAISENDTSHKTSSELIDKFKKYYPELVPQQEYTSIIDKVTKTVSSTTKSLGTPTNRLGQFSDITGNHFTKAASEATKISFVSKIDYLNNIIGISNAFTTTTPSAEDLVLYQSKHDSAYSQISGVTQLISFSSGQTAGYIGGMLKSPGATFNPYGVTIGLAVEFGTPKLESAIIKSFEQNVKKPDKLLVQSEIDFEIEHNEQILLSANNKLRELKDNQNSINDYKDSYLVQDAIIKLEKHLKDRIDDAQERQTELFEAKDRYNDLREQYDNRDFISEYNELGAVYEYYDHHKERYSGDQLAVWDGNKKLIGISEENIRHILYLQVEESKLIDARKQIDHFLNQFQSIQNDPQLNDVQIFENLNHLIQENSDKYDFPSYYSKQQFQNYINNTKSIFADEYEKFISTASYTADFLEIVYTLREKQKDYDYQQHKLQKELEKGSKILEQFLPSYLDSLNEQHEEAKNELEQYLEKGIKPHWFSPTRQVSRYAGDNIVSDLIAKISTLEDDIQNCVLNRQLLQLRSSGEVENEHPLFFTQTTNDRSAFKEHIVQEGDNLWSIAKENGIDYQELVEWNKDIEDINTIIPGQKVRLSQPDENVEENFVPGLHDDASYIVGPGETTSSIAEKIGLSEEEFCQKYNLEKGEALQLGDALTADDTKEAEVQDYAVSAESYLPHFLEEVVGDIFPEIDLDASSLYGNEEFINLGLDEDSVLLTGDDSTLFDIDVDTFLTEYLAGNDMPGFIVEPTEAPLATDSQASFFYSDNADLSFGHSYGLEGTDTFPTGFGESTFINPEDNIWDHYLENFDFHNSSSSFSESSSFSRADSSIAPSSTEWGQLTDNLTELDFVKDLDADEFALFSPESLDAVWSDLISGNDSRTNIMQEHEASWIPTEKSSADTAEAETNEDASSTMDTTDGNDIPSPLQVKQDADALLGLNAAVKTGDGAQILKAGLNSVSSHLNPARDASINNTALHGVASAIDLGIAIEDGDGLEIADSAFDLVKDIDRYCADSNFGNYANSSLHWNVAKGLNAGSSAVGLASAIKAGDDQEIAHYSLDLVTDLNNCFTDNGAAVSALDEVFHTKGIGKGLGGAASAVGLAMNIADIDDVFESGDALAITSTVADTISNVTNTLKYGAELLDGACTALAGLGNAMGAASAALQSVPGLNYIGAAVSLLQGDIEGAAISAASAYLMTCGPYGWAAAAILQIGSMLFGDDAPPEATASFSIDENGNVVMDVGGDSEMQEMAESYGNPMIAIMQQFKDDGNRLTIDGNIPKLTVIQGEDAEITYHSDSGGKITILLDDMSRACIRMNGALYARDRGERLDSAVKTATADSGDIDFARVDSIMAGHGFVKDGTNYIYGEDNSTRQGYAFGTGELHGGGNTGPKGQHVVAKAGDFKSLPLRPDQLPTQKMGEILKIINLNSQFGGLGAELLAMALVLPGGLAALNESVFAAEHVEPIHGDMILPLNAYELEAYLQGGTAPEPQVFIPESESARSSVPIVGDQVEMQAFLSKNWQTLITGVDNLPALQADQVYHFRDNIDYDFPYSDATRPIAMNREMSDEFIALQRNGGVVNQEFVNGEQLSFTGSASTLKFNDIHAVDDAPISSVVRETAVSPNHAFTMAEDSTLRITPVELAENTMSDQYTNMEDQFTFAGLGDGVHGRVWQDANGDIRFTPDENYFGAASFTYYLESPAGNIVKKTATVGVENVNDTPELIDDTVTLQEGEILDLNTLLANDYDLEEDSLIIDHLRGVEHGEVTMVNGALAFVPEAGYHGDIAFSYWARDHADSYPMMAVANVKIVDRNLAPEAGNDRFLVLEDTPLLTTPDKLLANDVEHDGESIHFSGLGDARHGSVRKLADGSIQFMPDADYAGDEAGFFYTVTDDSGNSATAWAEVEVIGTRDAPVVTTSTFHSIREDEVLTFSPYQVAAFISDPDGDSVELEMISNVQGGSIIIRNGYYSFLPDANFSGRASLDYQANDGYRGTVTGHLEFDVVPTENEPVNTSQNSVATSKEQVLSFTSDDPLTNDSDPGREVISDPLDLQLPVADNVTDFGNDHLHCLEETAVSTTVSALMANDSDGNGGGLDFVRLGESRNGLAILSRNGVVEFVPVKDYAGDNAGFSYIVRDAEGKEAAGWVSVEVENVNDVPIITGNRLHLEEDEQLAFTPEEISRFISDADDNLYQLDMVANVEGGRVVLQNGVYTFIPDEDFYGEASFDYRAVNEAGDEVSDTLHIGVIPTNDLPQTSYLAIRTVEDTEVTMKVEELLAGAHDREDGDNLRFGGIDSSLHGDVYVDTTGVLHFLPNDNFSGEAFFRYRVLDSEGAVTNGYVGVQVDADNDAPVAMDDEGILAWSNAAYENVYPSLTFLANDVDVDGDRLQIISIGEAEYGSVSLDSNGSIHYVAPTDDWVGVDSFTYAISDGNGLVSEATTSVDVKLNTSPDVYSERVFTQEDIISTLTEADLLANDSDVDSDTIHIIDVDQPVHCSVQLLANGSVLFTPELNYNNLYPGQAQFRYTVSDGISEPVTAVASFDIDPVNDKPIIRSERISGAVEDHSFSFTASSLLANDTDVEMASSYENDSIDFAGIIDADHGAISYDSSTDTVFYVPKMYFSGVDTFRYRITDSNGVETTGTSEIYVLPVNHRPVVQYDVSYGAEDSVWNRYSRSNLLGGCPRIAIFFQIEAKLKKLPEAYR